MMTKRERLYTVLSGKLADRPPICAYRHFPGREHTAAGLAEAMLEFQKKYDWDFIKIQSRGCYLLEAWGDAYDFNVYENQVFPKLLRREIRSIEDFYKFILKPVSEPALAEQIEVVRLIRAGLHEDVPVFPTVFTPINVISCMLGAPPVRRHIEAYREENSLFGLFKTDRERIHRALHAVASTLAGCCTELVKAGADGIFYGAIGWAREGYLTLEEWEEFVRPYDQIVLDAMKGHAVLLHTCGMRSNPQRFVSYPVSAIHWDQCADGNPDISGSGEWIGSRTPMGGVNEMLFGTNAASQIARESEEILQKNRKIPFIFVPNCSVAVDSLDEELSAFRNSVEHVERESGGVQGK
ncbi:MAG: uroporphyrinogen decarboxylase [Clostridiaceae bacterium]|nr:uroporphyrinogen decarboxylase [Clostridiaceae bacterium]